jgi:hypothetical protein
VPSALVLALGGGALMSLLDRRFAWLPVVAGVAYAAAAGLASWRIAKAGNRQEGRHLPAAFACIHLPAGAGMLAGLLKAAVRRRRRDE